MNRTNLIKLILELESGFEEEERFKSRFLELLQTNQNCFYRKSLERHITASAWIVDEELENALLIYHSKLNRWLQPGGHADGNEDLFSVAKKEVIEETGIDYRPKLKSIFDIDIHTIPEHKGIPKHDHYDVRFLMAVSKDTSVQRNNESKDISWKPLEVISKSPEIDRSIKRMIEKTRQLRGKIEFI
ncbi:MAG: NUDIX hydrolase [Bacteroidota bacterium]